jgi:hypothetical protein
MTPTLERLVALQTRDTELARIETQLRALPARVAKVEERLKAARAALEAHHQRLRQLEIDRRAGEREVEALLAQERKFQGQTMQVKTNEELWALKHEIELVHAQRSALETAVIERMEAEEAGRRETGRLEHSVSEAAGALEQETEAGAQARTSLEGGKARAAAERAALVAELEPELRARYERVRHSRGDPAVVPLVRNACGACLTAQPPQRLQEVKQGDIVVVCEFCGRLIVGLEGDGPRLA